MAALRRRRHRAAVAAPGFYYVTSRAWPTKDQVVTITDVHGRPLFDDYVVYTGGSSLCPCVCLLFSLFSFCFCLYGGHRFFGCFVIIFVYVTDRYWFIFFLLGVPVLF